MANSITKPKSKPTSRLNQVGFLSCWLALSLLIVCLYWTHFDLDYFNDEIYTLKHFVFCSLENTVLDYHVPNNHIFFNLINNLYSRVTGLETFHQALQKPLILRMLPLGYALGSLYLVIKIAWTRVSPIAALLSGLTLITTIPYFNFAFQLRGYGLSAFLLLAIVYFIGRQDQGKNLRRGLSILFLTALLFYAVPSNLYPIGGILLYLGFGVLAQVKNGLTSVFQSEGKLADIGWIFSGLALGLLFYSPIFKDVFLNGYVQPVHPFQWVRFYSYYLPKLGDGFLSNRWALPILMVLGIRYYRKNFCLSLLLLCVLFTPPILVLIRGDEAPLRIFTVLIPIFSLLAGVGAIGGIKFLSGSKTKIQVGLTLLLSVILLITFTGEQKKVNSQLYTAIENNQRKQDLYHLYYGAHYYPLETAAKVDSIHKAIAPFIAIQSCEPHGVANYFDIYDFPYAYEPNLDSLARLYQPLLIVTRIPNHYLQKKQYKPQLLSKKKNYHSMVLLNGE